MVVCTCVQSAKADNGLGGEVFVNKYDAQIIEKEEDSGYVSKMFEPKMPIVINEQQKNKWGSPRGYKVGAGLQGAKRGVNWAKKQGTDKCVSMKIFQPTMPSVIVEHDKTHMGSPEVGPKNAKWVVQCGAEER